MNPHSELPYGQEQEILLVDIATPDVVCLAADTGVREAAGIMAARHISSVVVTDDAGHPVGIVTERNIMRTMQAGSAQDAGLRNIMSAPVITVPPSITALEAYRLCPHHGIRHLVIVDEKGVLTGVASDTDFRTHLNLSALAGRRKISSIARRPAIVLPPSSSLQQALGLMLELHRGCVIVVADKKPVGIITERDVVRFYSGGRTYVDIALSEVMMPPLTISRNASTSQAAEEMLARQVRHLVVVDEAGLMDGLVNERDLTEAMMGSLVEERRGIEENFLRTLVNTLPDLVWLKDVAGAYQACNPQFERFFGAKEQDIVGKTDYDFVEKEQADSFREHDRMAMEADGPTVNEEWITFADDGHRELLETVKTPMRNRDGQLIGILGIARVITERKQLEEKLKESEQKFHSIFESVGDCIEIISADGRILDMNRIGYERLGYSREEMVGHHLSEFIPPEEGARIAERMSLMRTQEHAIFESARRRKDGTFMPLEVRSRHIEFEGQEVFLGISRDISRRVAAQKAMQQLNEDLSATLQAIPDLLFELDQDGRYLNIWAHDPTLLASQKEYALGRTINEVLPPKAAESAMGALREASENGYSQGQVIELDLPQGKRWFELSTAAKPAVNSDRQHFMMLSRDITDRMNAEAKLHDSHVKLSGLYKLTPMGIALTDMQGRYLEFNDAFRDICGYTREELNQLDYWELTPKEYADKEAEQLESLRTKGYYGPYEKEYIRKDGNRIPLRLNGVLIHDSDGMPYIWSVVEDITQSRQAEEALRKLSAAVEQSAASVIIADLDARIEYVNPHFTETTGYSADEAIGQNPRFLQSGQTPLAAYEEMWARLTGGQEWSGELLNKRKNGELYWEAVNISPIRDAHGRTTHYVGIKTEITARKRMEAALAESEHRYRNLVENSPFCIHEIDLQGRLTSMNHAGLCMLNLESEEQIRGVPYMSAVGEQDNVRIGALLQDAFNGKASHFEFTGTGNPPLEFKSCFIPIKDADGRVIKLMGITEDVTERKRIEEESRRLSAAVVQTGDAIALTDTNACYVYVNPAFCELFGYTQDELFGKSIDILAPPDSVDGPIYQQTIVAAREAGEFYGEVRRRAKDGRLIPILLKVTPFRTEEGALAGYIASLTDLSEVKRMEDKLRESERHFRDILEHAPIGMATTALDGRIIMVNQAFCMMLGYEKAELEKLTFMDISHPEDRDLAAQYRQQLLEGEIEAYQLEKRYLRKDGQIVWGLITSSLETDSSGNPSYFIAQVEDVTERKQAERAMRINASVFDNIQEAIVITSAENNIIDVNPAFTRITGYSRDEVVGKNPKLLGSGRQDKEFYAAMWQSLKHSKSWRGEIWNRRKSGEIYAELLSIAVICDDDGKVQRHVGVFSDISHLKEHEAELSRVANYDALTGIPNRRLLSDRLRQAIVRVQRTRLSLAICYIDLDGFKEVNDRHGHEAGDRLLVTITRRLQETLRAGDTLARLGGDEFVVLFNDLIREQECFQILDRILEVLALPVVIGVDEVAVSASIGVTFYPSDNEDGDTLLRHADQAMYVAKQTGKNRYHLYDPAHDQRVRSLHESRRRIIQGFENGEFELYYQPKIELATGKVESAEALIRWNHPERGLLLPAEFLPFVEDSDLEILMGEWVMDKVLAQLDAWHEKDCILRIAINISARHLLSPEFIPGLEARLAQHPHLPDNILEIEVLETVALEDIARSSATIEACRKLGVSFALDDFGTGYSSLAYLRQLSAETLKIDQSFVHGMLEDEGDRAIVRGIIALAGTFGCKTVAEGLESPESIHALADMGCMYGQGFGIARPMPAGEFMEWRRKK